MSPADAQLTGSRGCADPAAATICRRLVEPGSPGDDAPEALAALGSPAAPEDDLLAALDALAEAADAVAAARARQRAPLSNFPACSRSFNRFDGNTSA